MKSNGEEEKKALNEYTLKIDGREHIKWRMLNLALAMDEVRKIMIKEEFKKLEVISHGFVAYKCDIRMPSNGFKFVIGSGAFQ